MKSPPIFEREIKKLTGIYDYSAFKYKGKKVERRLELLRELIFVRAISALEIFLIDTIKEIFTLTKEPFKDYEGTPSPENRGILAYDSLSKLHSTIINNLCRKLSLGGHMEINKFYSKHFKINFSFILLQLKIDLDRYYEERNLLVHNLGKTNEGYRRKYNTNAEKIDITEDKLKSTLKNLLRFVKKINREITSKISVLDSNSQEKLERKVKVSIFKIKEGSNILKRNYSFWINDQFIDVRDIILEYLKISENSFEIVLGGDLREVSGVMKKLKQEKKKDIINYAITEDSTNIQNPFKIRRIHLTREQINKIKERLPSQPWPKHIHKTIAREFEVSNNQISSVISHLIKEGIFKDQIDGKIVNKEDNLS